jgi:hypothetical protein
MSELERLLNCRPPRRPEIGKPLFFTSTLILAYAVVDLG